MVQNYDSYQAENDIDAAQQLIDFIQACPSMFHTVATCAEHLDAAGFCYLPERGSWTVQPGGKYYTTRNGSSIVAWQVGEGEHRFQIVASHGDSPTFKLKDNPDLSAPGDGYRWSVEAYGGAIDYTWFDKPLSVAGRALVRQGNRIETRLVALNRDVALIPSVAIHLNREVNKGFAPNRAVDLCPLVSVGDLSEGTLQTLIADALEVDAQDICAHDLFLVNTQQPKVWGAASEFISSPKLDNLMSAYTSLEAFLAAGGAYGVSVFACFDNEEVGSQTKQGAGSTFLRETLARVSAALGKTAEEHLRALAGSFMVSSDNAHAIHPNHPEYADASNHPLLNRGIAVKEAANQHYCTDGLSRAVFVALLDQANIPYQSYANRSDMPGGSTLGNISNGQVSMHGVDVGCAQLAMHSSYETAGARDVALATAALSVFYATDLQICDGSVAF